MPSNMFYAYLTVFRCSAAVAAVATVTLNNGVEMPMMSLGTGKANTTYNPDAYEISVRLALQVGFTAIDTALDYGGVQEIIGRAVAEVERSSVFLTTKIGGAKIGTIATAYNRSLEEAYYNLKALNFDYVDLVLIHMPPKIPGHFSTEDGCSYAQEQWRALEDFMSFGKARAIGVSNFCQLDLACILQTATVVPAVNQLLLHVGMSPDPRGLVSYNNALGIKTMAFEPLGSVDYSHGLANSTRDKSLITGSFTRDLGQPYGKTGAQVALRWLVQHGILLATSASSEKHLREDLDVFEFTLDDADMQQLDVATTPTGEPNGYWVDIPVCDSMVFASTV